MKIIIIIYIILLIFLNDVVYAIHYSYIRTVALRQHWVAEVHSCSSCFILEIISILGHSR